MMFHHELRDIFHDMEYTRRLFANFKQMSKAGASISSNALFITSPKCRISPVDMANIVHTALT